MLFILLSYYSYGWPLILANTELILIHAFLTASSWSWNIIMILKRRIGNGSMKSSQQFLHHLWSRGMQIATATKAMMKTEMVVQVMAEIWMNRRSIKTWISSLAWNSYCVRVSVSPLIVREKKWVDTQESERDLPLGRTKKDIVL